MHSPQRSGRRNQPLASALHQKLRLLISGTPRLAERLEVQSVDGVGERLYAARPGRLKIALAEAVNKALAQAIADTASNVAPPLSAIFVQAEWNEVIDAWQVASWDTYRTLVRLGRKTQLPEARRLGGHHAISVHHAAPEDC